MPNIISLGICFIKIAPRQSWRFCLMQRKNSLYFRCAVWKMKSW